MRIKKHLLCISYGILLLLFTVYLMLDTFVIPKSYEKIEIDPSDAVTDTNISVPDEKDIIFTDTEYKDENISITLTQYREFGTDIYVAEIKVASPTLLKSALAKDTYGQNVNAPVSEIAAGKNAILAINGDFYGVNNIRYVIRNGALYRDIPLENREDIVIYKDGTYGTINESYVSAQQLKDNGAYQLFSFGPTLVKDGVISDTTEHVLNIAGKNPRTAIGFKEPGHMFFVVADGRTDYSAGLTFPELAQFMHSIGATDLAYNLDGGGSTTMYFNGKVVNKPSADGKIKEREVSDIVYIGY